LELHFRDVVEPRGVVLVRMEVTAFQLSVRELADFNLYPFNNALFSGILNALRGNSNYGG